MIHYTYRCEGDFVVRVEFPEVFQVVYNLPVQVSI